MKRLVYIHGANSTSRSFNYIQHRLPEHEILNIEYDVNTPFLDNMRIMDENIKDVFNRKQIYLIGHSLGGLFAVRLMNENKNVQRTFVMSAPFGGSRFIGYISWLCPSYQLFKDISVSSDVIKYFKTTVQTKPIMQVITSGGGNPLMGEPNDGTVTVSSQRAISGAKFKHSNRNHFEVLLDDNTVSHMNQFIMCRHKEG